MGKRLLVRLAAAAAGGALALAAAAPAYAQDTYDLQPSHENTFVGDHTQKCADTGDERMADKADNEDGYHFVLAGGIFHSLTVTFAPGGDPDDDADLVVITGTPDDPDSPIIFYPAGPKLPHAYVFVPAGWLLVTATAVGEGGRKVVVSHACAGEPDEEPEEPGEEPEEPGEEPEEPGEEPEEPGEEPEEPEEPGLPVTGSPVSTILTFGAGLLAVGGALAVGAVMMTARRRKLLAGLTDEEPTG